LNRPVYINAAGSSFPNLPVDNENIERVLGEFRGRPSRAKSVVLASNQIRTRFYAIDPETRKPTHSNAELAANAVLNILKENPELSLKDTQLLACGTSTPDLIIPAHGQMVQGHLPEFSGDVITTSGVCCSSMGALKVAYLSILSGDATGAVVTGSETASKFMRSEFFESESPVKVDELKANPLVAFEHDFLRWMLSDGAGALFLSDKAVPGKTNLKINWVEGRSFANEQPVCMFAGGHREEDGSVTPWKDLRLEADEKKMKHAMNASQDIRQLRKEMPFYSVEKPLVELKKKRGLRPGDYSWFVPHYSSHFFRETLFESMGKVDFQIPYERWFTELYDKGNIGSASMFVFIDQLIRQKSLQSGEKILCYIPESGRFSVYYMELEVV
jgi:3-oxoacyl-[acyl-carrier-protein] synthase-3